jgi:hypothetical protein
MKDSKILDEDNLAAPLFSGDDIVDEYAPHFILERIFKNSFRLQYE